MNNSWTRTNKTWASLNPFQRAALMALMEANGADPASAKNALGAMINRSAKTGVPLGEHVSTRLYQPTFEPAQERRIDRLMATPAFEDLSGWAERRSQGLEEDPVSGATHFLAPEKTMLSLEAGNPQKYKSWRKWTGYDANSGAYKGVTMRDGSHAFLAPDGAFSVAYKGGQNTNIAANGAINSQGPSQIASAAPPPSLVPTATPSEQGAWASTLASANAPPKDVLPWGVADGQAQNPLNPLQEAKFGMKAFANANPNIAKGAQGLSAFGSGIAEQEKAQQREQQQAIAQLEGALSKSNAQGLSEGEQEQSKALQAVMARRRPRGAFA